MRRLTFLLFLAIAAMGCVSPAWAKGIVFVLNSAGASISVIDMSTQKEVRRIIWLWAPTDAACWSATRRAIRCCSSIPIPARCRIGCRLPIRINWPLARFHRGHHGIKAAGDRCCNDGAVFPWWDMMFGTADFNREYVQTGDPSGEEALATGT